MASRCTIKLVDEKHVSAEVEHMLWSPKMDLIGIANVLGEVILYRLSWQKVWTTAPPAEGVKVGGMAWRPDGKVVAIGYTSGRIILCDVENAAVLHTIELEGEVTHMSWLTHIISPHLTTEMTWQTDNSALYLPKLQPLTKSYSALDKGRTEEVIEDSKKLSTQKELNLLIVGTSHSLVSLYAYGIFPISIVNLRAQPDEHKRSRVLCACISHDLKTLSVVVQREADGAEKYDGACYLLSYDTTLLSCRHQEIRQIALKYGQVYSLISYMNSTIQQMCEAWEDILMEMDSKLLKFAQQKKSLGTETVSNDFLELLMFGTPSPELEAFLLHDLTEKGLKKLGHSIETSYSNIQKLVVKHLQNVSHAILYHLTELCGMSQWQEKYGVLGLNHASLQDAVSAAGSFVLKSSELQQVIDGSIKNFKAFFRWLYVAILRLSDETPPAEISKMTQFDINFVTEFLTDNFAQFTDKDDVSEQDGKRAKHGGFKLEKVGQYLKNKDLAHPTDKEANPWVKYIASKPSLKESPLLYPAEANKSLLQVKTQLFDGIEEAMSRPSSCVGQSLQCVSKFFLSNVSKSEENRKHLPRFAQFAVSSPECVYTCFMLSSSQCENMYIIRHPTETSRIDEKGEVIGLTFGELAVDPDISNASDHGRCERHHILDIGCYDDKMLSVLVEEDSEEQYPVIIQLPLSVLDDLQFVSLRQVTGGGIESLVPVVDVAPFIQPIHKARLHNMKAHTFAVSGTRKVSCVLFSSRRRVRLFFMNADDDDYDEDDTSHMTDPDKSSYSRILESSRAGDDEDKNITGDSEMADAD